MKGLLHILLITGVVLFGLTDVALADEKDKKPKSTEEHPVHPGDRGEKKDTVLKVDDKEVGDTLVFDDYDEDDPTLTIPIKRVLSSERGYQCLILDSIHFDNQILATENIAKQPGTPIKENNPTSVETSELSLFPNPANAASSSEINVRHTLEGQVSITLIDQSGKMVWHQTTNSSEISFAPPQSGIYYVIITGGAQRIASKLLVQ